MDVGWRECALDKATGADKRLVWKRKRSSRSRRLCATTIVGVRAAPASPASMARRLEMISPTRVVSGATACFSDSVVPSATALSC